MASFETCWSMDTLLVSDTLSLVGEGVKIVQATYELAQYRAIMKLRLTKIWILLASLTIAGNASSEEELWCYQCNADLSEGRKGECNDPYTPASANLVLCPRNESHLCIKSLIFYKNVHVTVRGCVPSKEKSSYCSFKEAYPDASLECLFCSGYGCNSSPLSPTLPTNSFLIGSSVAAMITRSIIFDR